MNRRFAMLAAMALAVPVIMLGSSSAQAEDIIRLSAAAAVRDQSGALIGMVSFTQMDQSVLVRAEVNGLTPGFHGFHVHAMGACEGDFTSATRHWNRSGGTHLHHDGDMPSLFALTDGTASLRFETDRFSVADLFDGDGSTIIVHALPDNFAHIPTRYVAEPDAATLNTGDAGPRVGCGIVE